MLPVAETTHTKSNHRDAQRVRHIAIIMDGNGRWAKARGLPRSIGHREGVEAVRRAVRAAVELNIPYLTLYSFSSENWGRPAEEISDLMGLMARFIRRDLAELHQNNICIRVIGARDRVDTELMTLIDEGCELTKNNSGLTLVIAFNYGSRTEIVNAARKITNDVMDGRIKPEEIDEQSISDALETSGVPDPDLLIRTSGELRLSNFLLWQCAYTEFVFLDVNWPDFGREHLKEAIAEFEERERRYGCLSRRSTA